MTEDSLVDPLVTETAHRLLSEICDHESIQAAEARGQAPEIWNAFAETGFPWISIDEDAGGSGGSLLDALEVLRLVGYHAAPIPAAETGILGGWLLANSSQELPDGITTVVPNGRENVTGSISGDKVTITGRRYAWSSHEHCGSFVYKTKRNRVHRQRSMRYRAHDKHGWRTT